MRQLSQDVCIDGCLQNIGVINCSILCSWIAWNQDKIAMTLTYFFGVDAIVIAFCMRKNVHIMRPNTINEKAWLYIISVCSRDKYQVNPTMNQKSVLIMNITINMITSIGNERQIYLSRKCFPSPFWFCRYNIIIMNNPIIAMRISMISIVYFPYSRRMARKNQLL